ncbi:hypothetical protein [Ruegeria sp. ANG-R]|uniref:hypothetical protein n=1 Tax=Ruegeria sp. ANG-R TaxID=1577903 RepID=UPI0006898618|nr:hypothetical protein [Ruegeria sp. ANG-R]
MKLKLTVSAALAGLAVACTAATAEGTLDRPLNERDWLLSAETEDARMELLQQYLRGFDQPMWEVGARYQKIYEALELENYDLAVYHWKKIKTTIQNGYLKRPARQANADAILLNDNWAAILADFESRDIGRAWEGFDVARSTCMSCHEAENVGWMNDQPLFLTTEPKQ